MMDGRSFFFWMFSEDSSDIYLRQVSGNLLRLQNTVGCSPCGRIEGTRSPENSVDSRHCLFAESISEALGAQGLT